MAVRTTEGAVLRLKIAEFPDYAVDSSGRFFSRKNPDRKWRQVKGSPDKDGYLRVTLVNGGRVRRCAIHQLVLEAFVGPCPKGKEARHLDGKPSHNAITNLKWGSPKENCRDRTRHGTQVRGTRHGMSKLTEELVLVIRSRIKRGELQREVAIDLGVSRATVGKAASGACWRHVNA